MIQHVPRIRQGAGQCDPDAGYLITAARQPKIMLQVLPIGAGAYPGLDGRFAIASFAGSPDVVYLDNALVGEVAERVEDVPASPCSTTY